MSVPTTTKRRFPSLIRWIVWVLLVQFVLMNISAAIYAYRLTHFYKDPSLRTSSPDKNIFTKTWKLFTGPKQPRSFITDKPVFRYETIQLKTGQGHIIEAWYGKVDSLSKGTVILFHGITSNKGSLLQEAYEFRYHDYNVMLVDLRGHGNSDGNNSTIGYHESEEVKLAYDWIAQKGESRIFLYGVSLGAVVVAKAVGEYGLKPAGIVLDMPFGSLQSYLKNKARTLGFPQQPFAFLTTFWIGAERGYNGYRHNTMRYVKDITCPVLMQWGARDEFILKSETERIYRATGSAQKKLVIYEGAGHGSFLQHDPLRWRSEMEAFMKD